MSRPTQLMINYQYDGQNVWSRVPSACPPRVGDQIRVGDGPAYVVCKVVPLMRGRGPSHGRAPLRLCRVHLKLYAQASA